MADERKLAFKLGALTRMAEVGLTPTEFYKAAAGSAAALSTLGALSSPGLAAADLGLAGAGSVLGAAGDIAHKGVGLAGNLAVGLPAAGGATLGALDALADAPGTTDLSLLRNKELLGMYARLANEVRSRTHSNASAREARQDKPVYRGF